MQTATAQTKPSARMKSKALVLAFSAQFLVSIFILFKFHVLVRHEFGSKELH